MLVKTWEQFCTVCNEYVHVWSRYTMQPLLPLSHTLIGMEALPLFTGCVCTLELVSSWALVPFASNDILCFVLPLSFLRLPPPSFLPTARGSSFSSQTSFSGSESSTGRFVGERLKRSELSGGWLVARAPPFVCFLWWGVEASWLIRFLSGMKKQTKSD